MGKSKSAIKSIVLSTGVVIFSLAAAFSGTIAWFNRTKAATVTAGSFQVVGPEAADYELYYLASFTDEESQTQPGNYNTTIGAFLGYEVEYEDATFTKINYEDGVVQNDPDPTNVEHLWPAHKLTYAIVIDSANTISLSNWSETRKDTAKISALQYVCLSWAINMYGNAYNVTDTGNNANDVSTAFALYHASQKNNVFNYSQSSLAPSPWVSLPIVQNISQPANNEHTIIFFTIEFSNTNTTFYKYNKETTYYELDPNGNSNCYEGLAMQNLEFSIA